MDKLDFIILNYLSEGKTLNEIETLLKNNNIVPNTLSTLEKRIKRIKTTFKAKTLFHLAVILKEYKII
tara:strand:- start:4333 stop:4536 length:204 start_codon:yes stop_codon:yes gene_type:complete